MQATRTEVRVRAYGRVALDAVRRYRVAPADGPREAWKWAVRREFPSKIPSQEKPCPRVAFLGLCEEGLVKGIPARAYTRGVLNKEYTIAAYVALSKNPALCRDRSRLWKLALAPKEITENQQLDVLLALWCAKRLKVRPT